MNNEFTEMFAWFAKETKKIQEDRDIMTLSECLYKAKASFDLEIQRMLDEPKYTTTRVVVYPESEEQSLLFEKQGFRPCGEAMMCVDLLDLNIPKKDI